MGKVWIKVRLELRLCCSDETRLTGLQSLIIDGTLDQLWLINWSRPPVQFSVTKLKYFRVSNDKILFRRGQRPSNSGIIARVDKKVLVRKSDVNRKRWNLHCGGEGKTTGEHQGWPHSCFPFGRFLPKLFHLNCLQKYLSRWVICNTVSQHPCHSAWNTKEDQLLLPCSSDRFVEQILDDEMKRLKY